MRKLHMCECARPCVCVAVGMRGVRVEAGEGATCGGCYGDTVAVAALPIPWHTEDEAVVVAAASRSRPARWGGWVAVPVDEGLGGPRQPRRRAGAEAGPRPCGAQVEAGTRQGEAEASEAARAGPPQCCNQLSDPTEPEILS